jgi:hypothetical protein
MIAEERAGERESRGAREREIKGSAISPAPPLPRSLFRNYNRGSYG